MPAGCSLWSLQALYSAVKRSVGGEFGVARGGAFDRPTGLTIKAFMCQGQWTSLDSIFTGDAEFNDYP